MDNKVESLILEAISELRKDVGDIKTDTAVIKNELEQQKNDLSKSIVQLKTDAFPIGDTSGHRIYHESEMEKRKQTVDIKKEVTAHLIKGAFWAIAVGIFYAVISYVKEWMNK